MAEEPGLRMAISMAKANKVELKIGVGRDITFEGSAADLYVQILNGKSKKVGKTKISKGVINPHFNEHFLVSDHHGLLRFLVIAVAAGEKVPLCECKVEILNIGTFAVDKWYNLQPVGEEEEQKKAFQPDGGSKLAVLSKAFNRKTGRRPSVDPTVTLTPVTSPMETIPQKELENLHDPYMLIHLWDRPKVLYEHAAKVQHDGTMLDTYLTRLQKIEESYTKQLTELSSQYFKEHNKFKEAKLLKQAYVGLVMQTKHRADESKAFSDGLKALQSSRQDLARADQLLVEPAAKMKESISLMARTLAQSEEEVNAASKEMEDLKELEKSRLGDKFDEENWEVNVKGERKAKLEAIQNNLRTASIAETMTRSVYNEGLAREYSRFQALELERAEIISRVVLRVGEVQNKFAQSVYKKNLAVQQKYRAVNTVADLELWTKATGSDTRCPWGPQEDAEAAESVKDNINPFSRARMMTLSANTQGKTEEEKKQMRRKAEVESIRSGQQTRSVMSRGVRDGSLGPSSHRDRRPSNLRRGPPPNKSLPKIPQNGDKENEEAPKEAQEGAVAPAAEEDGAKHDNSATPADEDTAPTASVEGIPVGVPAKKKGSRKSHMKVEQSEGSKTSKKKKKSSKKSKVKKDDAKEEDEKNKETTPDAEKSESTGAPAAGDGASKEGADDGDENKAEVIEPEAAEADSKHGDEEVSGDEELPDVAEGEIYDGNEFATHDAAGGYFPNSVDPAMLSVPVVLDNGHAYMKAGYSGEMNPSLVIPSVLGEFPSLKGRVDSAFEGHPQFLFGAEALHAAIGISEGEWRCNTSVFSDAPSDWGDLLTMWGYMIHKLGADTVNHPLLMTVPTMAPTALKRQMYEVLFEQLQSPACFVAKAPLLTPYSYGSCTGLVVDIGDSSAQVVPVVDGYLIDAAVHRARHLGGVHDTNVVVQYLKEHQDDDLMYAAPTEAHLHHIARGMKDRMTFVPKSKQHFYDEIDILNTVDGGDLEEEEEMPRESAEYVNGYALHRQMVSAGEKAFQPKLVLDDLDESIITLPQLVTEAVSRCPNDLRIELFSNIHLSGGVATMPGFRLRFEKEIREILNPKARKHVHVFGDHECRYAVWRGGSVLTSLDTFKNTWITGWQWLEEGVDRVCEEKAVVSAVN